MRTVTDKFFKRIISYNDSNVSRLVCKEVCEYVDAGTEALKLDSCSILDNSIFRKRIHAAIKRRVVKCMNLSTIDVSSYMSLHTPTMFTKLSKLFEELFAVAPHIAKIETCQISNWLLTTALGRHLFNEV
jgi:hypothetical protein